MATFLIAVLAGFAGGAAVVALILGAIHLAVPDAEIEKRYRRSRFSA